MDAAFRYTTSPVRRGVPSRPGRALAALFDVSHAGIVGAWHRSEGAPALRFRLYKTAVLLFLRGPRSIPEADEDRAILAHLDELAELLVARRLLARERLVASLRREALTLAAGRLVAPALVAEAVAQLEADPGLAARLRPRASELLSGDFPSPAELAELAGVLARAPAKSAGAPPVEAPPCPGDHPWDCSPVTSPPERPARKPTQANRAPRAPRSRDACAV